MRYRLPSVRQVAAAALMLLSFSVFGLLVVFLTDSAHYAQLTQARKDFHHANRTTVMMAEQLHIKYRQLQERHDFMERVSETLIRHNGEGMKDLGLDIHFRVKEWRQEESWQ